MKKLFGLVILTLSFSAVSNSVIYPFSCNLFHRYDNFYLAAAKVMKPNLELPSPEFNDEFCFAMGEEHAKESLEQASYDSRLKRCIEAFDYGFGEGMQGSQTNMRSPTYCYNIGLHAGFSSLSNFAREQREDKVGKKCLQSFDKGYDDGTKNRPQSPGLNNKLAMCYLSGYRIGNR